MEDLIIIYETYFGAYLWDLTYFILCFVMVFYFIGGGGLQRWKH
jgi:hypothetical protein